MIIFKNKIFISLILIIIVIINSYAQNAIDLDGGFVALTPNGNIDDGGWPLGEQYDGVNANSSIWRTATNYVATGGAGWLQLGNPNASETTTIYLRNGITRVVVQPSYMQILQVIYILKQEITYDYNKIIITELR